MIYASSKDRFKRELDGIQVELQATDPTEMGLDVIEAGPPKFGLHKSCEEEFLNALVFITWMKCL